MLLEAKVSNPKEKKFIKGLFSAFDTMIKFDPDSVFEAYEKGEFPSVEAILEFYPKSASKDIRSSLEKTKSESSSITPPKKTYNKGLRI